MELGRVIMTLVNGKKVTYVNMVLMQVKRCFPVSVMKIVHIIVTTIPESVYHGIDIIPLSSGGG